MNGFKSGFSHKNTNLTPFRFILDFHVNDAQMKSSLISII